MTFSERAVEAAKKAAPRFWQDTSNFEKHMTKCLTAALAVDGLALVPKEPTQAMIDAGTRETTPTPQDDPWYGHIDLSDSQAEQCYRAMLTAASDGEAG